MSKGLVHRLQEGALSAAKTPAPPAPTKLVPVANGSRPAEKPASEESSESEKIVAAIAAPAAQEGVPVTEDDAEQAAGAYEPRTDAASREQAARP